MPTRTLMLGESYTLIAERSVFIVLDNLHREQWRLNTALQDGPVTFTNDLHIITRLST